jgi:hypothetical protein
MDFTGIITSLLGGGATGLFGVVIQRWADFKNKELDLQLFDKRATQELAMREMDAKLAIAEATSRQRIAEIQAAGASDVAESAAFAASYGYDNKPLANQSLLTPKQNWLFVFVDTLRGIVRPLLTLYLCVLVTAMYVLARDELKGEDINVDQALQLVSDLMHTVLYVWVTVTLWWFGTRNKGSGTANPS